MFMKWLQNRPSSSQRVEERIYIFSRIVWGSDEVSRIELSVDIRPFGMVIGTLYYDLFFPAVHGAAFESMF
jgi:hypothetical protein